LEEGPRFRHGADGRLPHFDTGRREQGGIFTKTPQTPAPFWLYYFDVDAIDVAAERVKAKGGPIINGPLEVPTGRRVLLGLDPQEAMFALVAPKR
jgi:predicted enzyme related to lactoylglutathione lyase